MSPTCHQLSVSENFEIHQEKKNKENNRSRIKDNSTYLDETASYFVVVKLSILMRKVRRNSQKFQNYSAICLAKT